MRLEGYLRDEAAMHPFQNGTNAVRSWKPQSIRALHRHNRPCMASRRNDDWSEYAGMSSARNPVQVQYSSTFG